jgi:hypothetical protein
MFLKRNPAIKVSFGLRRMHLLLVLREVKGGFRHVLLTSVNPETVILGSIRRQLLIGMSSGHQNLETAILGSIGDSY